ncbi:MFS transporter [Acinetobacter qingfengensis]|uniref:Methyl viologen resistance protein SmvA n=1 Tax=Acinetobacter qingfengensis TaxID=1262585 RepID=A0A1E7R8Y5_9GAMM|nr:MFS transporter [Acinetobacter qingfengensis]KAA8735553.1 MFS transporter [Acinetobacter qingfengensis]OEY95799.1 methyl viologen resistance protein SmvA [Acinetobacter qingfengensis]
MLHKWYILAIVVLIYLPVSIDATVLHVAVPTLTQELALSNNQMLWIIDIYSLMMAGLILPMGALGERLGYKRLMLIGAIIFQLGSVIAAFSPSAGVLLFARVILACGAAMLIPATLACVRNIFLNEKERNFALGIWVIAGGGGAAFGPLLGGFLLEHYHWGTVFLINIPLIFFALIGGYYLLPAQAINANKHINIVDALVLTCSILLLIYTIKTSMKAFDYSIIWTGLSGLILLVYFIQKQRKLVEPLIDLSLFKLQSVKMGFLICVFAMIALVGFELLISQELQFVYGFSPLEAGLFILPFMLAVSLSGIFASLLINKFGVRLVSLFGLAFSAIALIGLAETNFTEHTYYAWFWMIVLGASVETTFLAATSAIISASPVEKATAAGSIEGMSYELGTGFGVAIFGLLVSYFYQKRIQFEGLLNDQQLELAKNSIAETIHVLSSVDPKLTAQIQFMANQAFSSAHHSVLYVSSITLLILMLFVTFSWKIKKF